VLDFITKVMPQLCKGTTPRRRSCPRRRASRADSPLGA
jgi:hypothetical protein